MKRNIEQEEEREKRYAHERVVVLNQVKALLVDACHCRFSFYESKGYGTYPSLCAIKMTPAISVGKKVEYDSVYLADNATFGMHKKGDWITAEKVHDEDHEMYRLLQQFIEVVPIFIWMQFMAFMTIHTTGFLPLLHDKDCDEKEYDILYRKATWVSIKPCFFGASFNIVIDETNHFALGIMIHSTLYVYLTISKDKARVLMQCMEASMTQSIQYHNQNEFVERRDALRALLVLFEHATPLAIPSTNE